MLESAVILIAAALGFILAWMLRGKPMTARDAAAHAAIAKIDARLDAVEGLARGVIKLLDDMKNQRAQQQAQTVNDVRAELGKMMGMKVDPEAPPARHVPVPSFGRTL